MKKILNTILILVIILGSTSCNKWLDVNTDPNNPSESSAQINIRLPWIQHYYMYAWGSASMRTSTISGLYTINATTNTNGMMASWNPTQSICTTVYQNWFLGGFVNVKSMITKAEETGSTHYIAAGLCMKAMGTLLLLDLHGEMPYTEAATEGIFAPAYDNGETLYKSSMADIDKAIELFSSPQSNSLAIPLTKGDSWNGGDIDKWIKLCYGLKARYLLQISKKSIYNDDAVLAALENAPLMNEHNTYMQHYNIQGDALNFTVSDPYQTNQIWDCLSYGTTQRTTKWYINLLTNEYTGGSKVIDPRLDRLVPSIMTAVVADKNGIVQEHEWRIDQGVDVMNSDVRIQGGPVNAAYADKAKTITYKIADNTERANFIKNLKEPYYKVNDKEVEVTYPVGAFYVNSNNYKRAGDTLYVNMKSMALATKGKSAIDMYFYTNNNDPKTTQTGAVSGTGTFYSRPTSDSDILTYSEMCFIKAEVYMRKGDKTQAHTAYINGIKANFERMQTKLNIWKSEGTINPFQMPMDQADIDAYLASDAVVQVAANLTMSEIIKQKIIALGPNIQVWNDMRRLNYSAGNIKDFGVIYIDYKRPSDFSATNKITGGSPTDDRYWFRRFSQSSHESNYNNKNLMASNPLAMQDGIWSDPVWWDIAD